MSRRKRKATPDDNVKNVLVMSRRGCCICYGLNRNDDIKKGQIAHLDGDPQNFALDNLAFLCFDHHDYHDTKTSQSKGSNIKEVKQYRKELYDHFGMWGTSGNYQHLFNFLASTIDADHMVDALLKAASRLVWDSERLAHDVLTMGSVDYCDLDLYIPHVSLLDTLAYWGCLDYEEEEKDVDGETRYFLTVEYKPICEEMAKIIKSRDL